MFSNATPPTHSPSSVWLIWNGPEGARHILCAATTEKAAHEEIGRRFAKNEGAPIQNPVPEEVVVVGDPDPRSIEARIAGVAKPIQDGLEKIIEQWDKR